MAEFNVRALEIHSQHAWDFNWVMKAIKFMSAHDMNTLILHRNDFIDLIVYPGKYFGAERDTYRSIFERYQDIFRVLYKYTPTRRSGPYQRRAYLKRVLEMAKRHNIQVYIENKELFFPEILLEFHPHLVKQGKICANDPFWWEFTRVKYKEFFEEFPEVSGIITAMATGESKISITSNRCECERCRQTKKHEWFQNLAMAMYEPIQAAGKQLVIRDFVFDSEAHREISRAMEQLPDDIVFALKNTPHDYYPTFPDNPRIGKGKHRQWIEFDSMGQYFGWGIAPGVITEDYRRRMQLAKDSGAVGVILRTDWESLDGHTYFDTLNAVNMYTFSALAVRLDADTMEAYKQWIADYRFVKAGLTEEELHDAAAWLRDIMEQTWEVTKRTAYVNDCVFTDSSQLPISLAHAYWLAEEKNSLKDWDPSKEHALEATEDNLRTILAEKDDALTLVRELRSRIHEGHAGLSEQGYRYLSDCFDVFEKYVRAFRTVVRAIVLTKYKLERKDGESAFAAQAESLLEESLQELTTLAEEFQDMFRSTDYNHRAYTLLDADRLLALHQDLSKQIKQPITADS